MQIMRLNLQDSNDMIIVLPFLMMWQHLYIFVFVVLDQSINCRFLGKRWKISN